MTGLTHLHRYMLYRGRVDFRNGFDGLCGLVRREMNGDPADGSVWIFSQSTSSNHGLT
ncbi:MAG: transposase [Saprospiraceae bacterium]|nr:transposase [Saprospiraceae bacterium]